MLALLIGTLTLMTLSLLVLCGLYAKYQYHETHKQPGLRRGLEVKPPSPKSMTFMEAIKLGYIRQQGNWKDAPWVFDNRIMPSATAALDEANRHLKAHWAE